MRSFERNFELGFFEDDPTSVAIRKLAAATDITLFCGAGVSLDQGMPTWAQLVTGLLAHHLNASVGLSQDVAREYAKHVANTYYQVPTATLIDAQLSESFGSEARRVRQQRIHDQLYPSRDLKFNSPSLAEEVLLLAHAFKADGRRVRIVTTNYDDLLEWVTANRADVSNAFEAYGYYIRPYYMNRPQAIEPGEIPIVHVHGYIPRTLEDTDYPVVLSETDYTEWGDSSQFSSYLSNLFSSTTVLFVGTSLRDVNILSKAWLSPGSPSTTKYAIVPVQEELNELPVGLGQYWTSIANHLCERGAQLNINVLRPDFFGQVPQLLNEVAEAVRYDTDYVSYMDRVNDWSARWFADYYSDDQRRLEATMRCRNAATQVHRKLAKVDHVKIEVWIRKANPDRALELWASSQTMWPPGDGYWPKTVPLHPHAVRKYSSVQAFAAQSAVHGRLEMDNDRWTHFFAVPIVLDGDFMRIPVGSVVLLLNSESGRSLEKLDTVLAVESEVRALLTDLGRELTFPDAPPDQQ